MRYLVIFPLLFAITGCTAIKHKQHTLFCVGACIHHEGDTQKEGGEPPKKPAPVVTPFKEP